MTERPRRLGIWTGIALIVVTNALILGRVLYNRSDVPESTLHLSERELALPFGWGMATENSGLSLRILYQVANGRDRDIPSKAEYAAENGVYFGGNEPEWLDDARLAGLGFDVEQLRARAVSRHGARPTSKEVLFVLEFDGPAYAAALAQERLRRDEEAATAAMNPSREEFARRAKKAADAARYAEHEASRLFVVDAGLDRQALRARYPDRNRYAIVRGVLQPFVSPAGKPAARIDRLSIGDVNVPYEFRQSLGRLAMAERMRRRDAPRNKFEATLNWGKQLEPWVLDAIVR